MLIRPPQACALNTTGFLKSQPSSVAS